MPEAFPGATGCGLRVAVIDSGVHARHPHVNGVAGGVSIGAEKNADDYVDCLGHGTAVLAAIKDHAPNADYFAVQIYLRTLQTDIHRLIRALDWAIENRMDVVNLSLGTVNQAHRESLAAMIERAGRSGMLIVAAVEADSVPALPGSLPGVIAASADWSLSRSVFQRDKTRAEMSCWLASGYPRELPGVSRDRNLKGVSFAVANLTGIVLRAREISGAHSLFDIDAVLAAEANRLSKSDR